MGLRQRLVGAVSAGLTSLNSDTTPAQIILVGTGLSIDDSGNTHTISLDGIDSSKWTELVNTLFPKNDRRVGLGKITEALAQLHMTETLLIDDLGEVEKTGTISLVLGQQLILGVGTLFKTEIQIGDQITVATAGIFDDEAIVIQINSDTSLIINKDVLTTISDVSFKAFSSHLILRVFDDGFDTGFDHQFFFGLGHFPPHFKFHLHGTLGYTGETQILATSELLKKVIHFVDTSTVKTINIPATQEIIDRTVFIKDVTGNAGTNNITVNSVSGKTFEGETDLKIIADYGSVLIHYTGIEWVVLS